MPYYGVARVKYPGVYTDWDECQASMRGSENAVFCEFSDHKEAYLFVCACHESDESEEDDDDDDLFNWGAGDSPNQSSDHDGYSSESSEKSNDYISNKGYRYTSIYVDGAARGNGKVKIPNAGYGIFFKDNDLRNESVEMTKVDDVYKIPPTNQRAELRAVLHALGFIKSDILYYGEKLHRYIIYSDSEYSLNCLLKWRKKWELNGYINSKGFPVANADVIKEACSTLDFINNFYNSRHTKGLLLRNVKGHRGVYGNEQADKLANEGADNMERSMRFMNQFFQ